MLDARTWSCSWERRNQKAEAGGGVQVAETAAIPSFCKVVGIYERDRAVSLLLGSQAGTAERPELGITHGRGSLGEAVHMGRTGLDFPPGFAYLAARGACSLAPDQAVAQGAGRAGRLPRGCCGLGQASRRAIRCYRGAFVS